jgi:hypothetical protein
MKHNWIILALICATLTAQAEDVITVVDTTDVTAGPNLHYAGNREPLVASPLIKLPAGSVKAQGWLRKQLEMEGEGMVGHLSEISTYCNPKGNAWRSTAGEGSNGWEELPYWFRGFTALAYALDDPKLIAEAKEWIEPIIASQREDGFFGPRSNLRPKGDHDMMPNMFMLFALRTYHEATGDPRILPLMTKFFQWQLAVPDKLFFANGWQFPRNGDNMDSVYWLYNRTGEPFLLELAAKLRRTGATMTKAPATAHNVDFSMAFRKLGQFYQQSKDPADLQQTDKNFEGMFDLYGQVPGGMFCGDEFARPGYTDPRNSIETCGIVEMMFSQEILLRVSGELKWADRCEDAAYNSLPAAMTADRKAIRYLTSANHIYSDRRNRGPEVANSGEMFVMDPNSHRCCQHNVGMGWPYFSENLWQATPGNGLAAIFYSASEVRAKVGTGEEIKITQTTNYPFDGQVDMAFDCAQPVAFPLYLRVPAWCPAPKLTVNGKPVAVEGRAGSFIRVERTWAKGDKLALTLPMEVSVKRWEKNHSSASVNRGPLTFSVKIGEQYTRSGGSDAWPAFDLSPTTPWNYGLALDPGNPAAAFEVVSKPWPASNNVFTHENSPVEIRAKVRKITNWKDTGMGMPGKLQPSPTQSSEPLETISLIPMGAGRLRIAAFPVIGSGADARAWRATDPMPASYWPKPESIAYLRDGRLPSAGGKGVDCFKWVGWAGYATGLKHWVRQDFEQEETVSSCEVHWAADGGSFVTQPEAWTLSYLVGDGWKEVELKGAYPLEQGKFVRVAFTPVKTRALRIDMQSKPKKSAGINEWRSWVKAGTLVKHSSFQPFGVDPRGEALAKTVSSTEVSWSIDPANPQSQPPKTWKLFARQGDEWKEVANPSGYGLDPTNPNTVSFDPVLATGLRLDVFADEGVSAGPRDWRTVFPDQPGSKN